MALVLYEYYDSHETNDDLSALSVFSIHLSHI